MASKRKRDVEEDMMATPTAKQIKVEDVTRSGRVRKKPAKFVREAGEETAKTAARAPAHPAPIMSPPESIPIQEAMPVDVQIKQEPVVQIKQEPVVQIKQEPVVQIKQEPVVQIKQEPVMMSPVVVTEDYSDDHSKTPGGRAGRKRGLSGYLLWFRANRAQVVADNPGIDFGTISKKMGEMWSAMSEREKMIWKGSTLITTGKATAQKMVPLSQPTSVGYSVLSQHDISTVTAAPNLTTKQLRAKQKSKKIVEDQMGLLAKKQIRGLTSYVLWNRANRARIAADNPGIAFGTLSKKMGEMWSTLSEREKMDQYGGASDLSTADEAVVDVGAGPEPLGITRNCNTLMSLKYVKSETGGRKCIKCLHEFTGVDEFEDHLAACFCEDCSDPQENVDNETLKSEPVVDDTEGSMHDPDDFEIKVEVDEDAVTDDTCEIGESGENSAGSRFQNVTASVEGTMSNVSGRKLETNVDDTSSECSMRRYDCDIKIEPVTDGPDNSMHDLNNSVHDLNDSMRDTDDCDIKMEVIVADYRNKFDEETTGDGTHDDVSDHEMEADIASYTQTTFHDAAGTDGGTGEFELNDIETQITEENHSLQITGVFCNKRILNNRPVGAKTKSLALVCPRCGVLFNSHDTLAMHACMIQSI